MPDVKRDAEGWPLSCYLCGRDLPHYERDYKDLASDPVTLNRLKQMSVRCEPCDSREDARRQKTETQSRVEMALSEIRDIGDVTTEFEHCSFRHSIPEKERSPDAWSHAGQWQPGQANVYLHGSPGTGKTFLCRCLLWVCLEAEKSVAEVTAKELFMLSTGFDNAAKWARLKSKHTVLVDDVDKGVTSSNHVAAFWEFINARVNAGKRTLFTSNMPLSALLAQLIAADTKNESTARAAIDRLKPLTQFKIEGASLR